VKRIPENQFTGQAIQKRFETYYGGSRDFAEGRIPYLREKRSGLSEFFRALKAGLARFYNRRQHRRGYYWGDRFKSVIVCPLAIAVSSRSLRMTLFTGRRCDFLAHLLIDFFVAPLTVFMQGVGMVLELPLF
jgi:hypothetical protein